MAYDEALAARVREVLCARRDVVEKKMFGGLCFMVGGQMAIGVEKQKLMVRVGPEAFADALAQPHAQPMDFTGRPLRGFVYVMPAGLKGPALARWVARGIAGTADAKKPAKKTTAAAKKTAAKKKPGAKAKR